MTALLTSMGALLVASVAFAHAPAAHAAASCGGTGRNVDGYTYLSSLTVSHTSCSTGRNVVKHHGHLSGWHCSKKTQTSSIQVQGRETCKSGRKSVVWTYTQNK
jgi:hypothetical protein